MNKNKLRTNYPVPLGEFRTPLEREPDPAWVWIHEERTRRGFSADYMAEQLEISSTCVSKGERGGFISLEITQKILRYLGRELVMVELEGGPR